MDSNEDYRILQNFAYMIDREHFLMKNSDLVDFLEKTVDEVIEHKAYDGTGVSQLYEALKLLHFKILLRKESDERYIDLEKRVVKLKERIEPIFYRYDVNPMYY